MRWLERYVTESSPRRAALPAVLRDVLEEPLAYELEVPTTGAERRQEFV